MTFLDFLLYWAFIINIYITKAGLICYMFGLHVTDLGKDGCMSEFSWQTGGCYGKSWGEHLPSDAGVSNFKPSNICVKNTTSRRFILTLDKNINMTQFSFSFIPVLEFSDENVIESCKLLMTKCVLYLRLAPCGHLLGVFFCARCKYIPVSLIVVQSSKYEVFFKVDH